MKHEKERNPYEKMPTAEVANRASTSGKLGEGRKAALQPQPMNLREFFQLRIDSSCVDDINSVSW